MNEVGAIALGNTKEAPAARVYLAELLEHEHDNVRAIAYAIYLDLPFDGVPTQTKLAALKFSQSPDNAELATWAIRRKQQENVEVPQHNTLH